MKREDLRKLGLTDEQIDQVMSMNGDDVNAQRAIVATRDEAIKALTTERDGLKGQVTDRDKDIAELKKANGDSAALTQKLTDLQKKYDDDTAKLNKQLDDQARSHAVEGLFNGIEFTSGMAKRAAMKEFEAAGLEFKDGKFTGADDAIKKMRDANPDAFKVKEDAGNSKGNQQHSNYELPKFTNTNGQNGGSGNGGSQNPFHFNFTACRDAGTKQ